MSRIVHVVLVEWRPEVRGEAPAEADALVEQHLRGLPGVLTVDHGPSVSGEGLEDGFEWALVIRFETEEALAAYLPHPEHRIVGGFLQAGSARLVVFDLAEG